MSGFTYRSGLATRTVSLYCPICCQRRSVTADMLDTTVATVEQLCCPEHVKVYSKKVRAVEKMAWLFCRNVTRLPTEVSRRCKVTGVLSKLAVNFLQKYVS